MKTVKKILIAALLMLTGVSYSQDIKEIDSLTFIFCDYLKNVQVENDFARFDALNKHQIIPYLTKFEEEERDDIFNRIYFRLQRNCRYYVEVLNSVMPPDSDVQFYKTKPESVISRFDLNKFKSLKSIYYEESNGDLVKVDLGPDSWVERFIDGTFSNLKMKWVSKTEFKLTFVESDNLTRKNYSIEGDEYLYEVISKSDNYFTICGYNDDDSYFVGKFYFE